MAHSTKYGIRAQAMQSVSEGGLRPDKAFVASVTPYP